MVRTFYMRNKLNHEILLTILYFFSSSENKNLFKNLISPNLQWRIQTFRYKGGGGGGGVQTDRQTCFYLESSTINRIDTISK